MSKHTYIILIFFLFSLSNLLAQDLNLIISGSNNQENTIINSLEYKKKHPNYNSIINEVDTVAQKLIKTGYIDYEQSPIKKLNDTVFKIKLKLNTKYNLIKINYNNSVIDKKIIDEISKNSFEHYFIIPFKNIEKTLETINNKISNNGFPFSKIKLSNLKKESKNSLTANLIILKGGNKRSLDKITIKGYEKFPKSYLKRFLKIKTQKKFNIEEINRKMTTLKSLGFAEQTKNPEALFTKDSTTLYIYLKKLQNNAFDGFLGFNTNEETNKIDFNGYINLKLNNNLNYGESFNLIYKSDESQQKNFEINLNLPYLFSTPIGTELSLQILKRDSSFTSVSQKANLFYQLTPKSKIFLGIENVESNNLLNNELNLDIEDYNSNNINLKYIFENANNTSNLFRLNSKINLELSFGKRKTENLIEEQEKYSIDAFYTFKINKKNSFYTRIQAATKNSETYFENELFRFGGINSIRGFQENSILANKFYVFNTEYRYELNKNLYSYTIIDFSNYENKISNTKENLYGFGLGFGLLTRAGLLKFNFANGKSENQNFVFSNSKIHISLVSFF
ncbi:outer membrane protein assembly factor BamA [Lacinutrix venerupis]|uniref:POTRA domain-containing protein n=1 Tax=Lacinutrix venerupis TaxID=1486034 RepID=UPI000EB30604|nr:POTRA domain-containing protein [Lacinutrix venerupis]RLJ61953.1 outer membrane protein assembly factor BamA [Lacinutrix venerupis]